MSRPESIVRSFSGRSNVNWSLRGEHYTVTTCIEMYSRNVPRPFQFYCTTALALRRIVEGRHDWDEKVVNGNINWINMSFIYCVNDWCSCVDMCIGNSVGEFVLHTVRTLRLHMLGVYRYLPIVTKKKSDYNGGAACRPAFFPASWSMACCKTWMNKYCRK